MERRSKEERGGKRAGEGKGGNEWEKLQAWKEREEGKSVAWRIKAWMRPGGH